MAFIPILILISVFASVLLFYKRPISRYVTEYLIHEQTPRLYYLYSAGFVLGEYLSQKYPESKVLIIVRKGYDKLKRIKFLVNALKTGFGNRISEVVLDYPRPEKISSDKQNFLTEEVMTAKNLDALIKKHSDCNLIISLMVLPKVADKMKIWKMKDDKLPKFALLFTNSLGLKQAIKEDHVSALVTYIPDLKFSDSPPPKDLYKAFDECYIIITPENVEELDRKYPELFMTEDKEI